MCKVECYSVYTLPKYGLLKSKKQIRTNRAMRGTTCRLSDVAALPRSS